jgi:cell division transport system permease protein
MSRRAERRILDEAGGVRAMTGVLAIMLFLTVLAGALGLSTARTTRGLDRQLAGRLTVQVVDGDPVRRDAVAVRVRARLRAMPAVRRAVPVAPAELARLVEPWLGTDAASAGLPMPAMIDVDLADADAAPRVAAAIRAVDPAVRVDAHESWMSPVSRFMATMTALAATLVLLMATATGAVVVLAARAGLETHRPTIEVMHMLGSTDIQIARLFQRRLAIDALIGGITGTVVAILVILFVGARLSGLGSDLLGQMRLSAWDWGALAMLPVLFALLAVVAARFAVTMTLRRRL